MRKTRKNIPVLQPDSPSGKCTTLHTAAV